MGRRIRPGRKESCMHGHPPPTCHLPPRGTCLSCSLHRRPPPSPTYTSFFLHSLSSPSSPSSPLHGHPPPWLSTSGLHTSRSPSSLVSSCSSSLPPHISGHATLAPCSLSAGVSLATCAFSSILSYGTTTPAILPHFGVISVSLIRPSILPSMLNLTPSDKARGWLWYLHVRLRPRRQ